MSRAALPLAVALLLAAGFPVAPGLPLAPGELAAQATRSLDSASRHHASAYLPLGHWAYPMLDYWISIGRAETLSPFMTPYRRMDVARAVHRLEEERLGGVEEDWLRRFQEELGPELAVLRGEDESAGHFSLHLAAGATYRSQTHRDPLRPELEGRFSADRVLEHIFLDGNAQVGIVAGAARVGRDGIFRQDAQFPDGRVVVNRNAPFLDELGIRVEEGYVELQTRYASLFFGRMDRNWGLPRLPGFVRSGYAYSYEEIGYRFGVDRIFLAGTFTSLPDFSGDTTRFLSVHRLELRPVDQLVVAVTEAVIHGGPSRPLDLRQVNPLGIWHITDSEPRNAVGQVDLWWRPVRGLALYGSLIADATNSPRTSNSCCGMGGSVGLELSTLARGAVLRLQGTAIQSLVYRTSLPWEEWSVERIGLGWDKADLYLFTAEADWFRPGGLLLRPRLDIQVLGEGDFRQLRPPGDELPDLPRILIGEAELTVRPAVAGRWRSGGAFPLDLEWDLGVNFIDDVRHQAGERRTEFVGSLRLVVETPPALFPLGR